MATLDIGEISDTLVLHFGGEYARINAYTLATAVTGIADAAKAINSAVNPGYELEVVVEAFGGGSFRTTLRAILREGRNLFTAESARNVILGIVATIIYERVLAPKDHIVVNVSSSEVVVEAQGERIVVPRFVYDTSRQVQQSPLIQSGVGRAIQAIAADPAIESFGVSRDPRSAPPIPLKRELLAAVPTSAEETGPDTRVLEEVTEVQILRAILERSKRRWEFVWNGLRISAPILDEDFFSDFFAHRITIAPGDSLRVKLRLRQKRLPDLGIYVTETYEVVEVLRHIPIKGQQTDLHLRRGA